MRNRMMAAMAIAATMGAILALPSAASAAVPCAYSTENGVIHASNITPAPGMKEMDFLTATLDTKATAPPWAVGHRQIGLRDATGAKDPFEGVQITVVQAPTLAVNPHRYFGPPNFKATTEKANRAGSLLHLQARGSDKKLLERPKNAKDPGSGSGGIIYAT